MDKKMFVVIVVIGICLFSKVAKSESPCRFARQFAKTVMTFRQQGYSEAECKKILDDAFYGLTAPKFLSEMMDDILSDAYSRPVYDSQEYKENEIRDFAHEKYMECLDELY